MARLRAGLFAAVSLIFAMAAAHAEPLVVDIASAEAGYNAYGDPVVVIRLSSASTDAFGELTAANIGLPLSVVVDGEVVSQPIVREPILGGSIEISGDFDDAEAAALAARMIDGTATVSFEPVSD